MDPSVAVRRIRSSDQQDLLEIAKRTWRGHDYLPFVIDDWLRNPKCHTYGVEVEGRIVAVGNLRVVDRDRTGWMEGLRVHPDHRRKGFANTITKHLVDLATPIGVRRLRYTTASNNRASLKLAKKFGFSRKLQMAVFWYGNIRANANLGIDYPRITETSPEQTRRLSRSNPSLIPCNILIYDWKALDGTLNGFEQVGKTHTFHTARRKGKMDSISFSTILSGRDESRWSFTVHASNREGFLAHIFKHVTLASNQGLNLVVCTFGVEFEELLRELEWESEFQYKLRVVLLEKLINTANI